MNEIQSYLTRKQGDLVTEAASKKIIFKKKDDLFRLLKEEAPLEQIKEFIRVNIGKNYQQWHYQKFQAIHEELQVLRGNAFETFARKARIERYNMSVEDLEALRKSMLYGREDAARELIASRIKGGRANKIVQMAIDWMAGKDIESDKEEETPKLTPASIERLKVFIAETVDEGEINSSQQAELLQIVLKEDWVKLQAYIEKIESDSNPIVESIRQKYVELVEQSNPSLSQNIPTYTEGDKSKIREYLIQNMEDIEKDEIDNITEACSNDDWETVRTVGEKYYGENDMVQYITSLKEFLDQKFPEVRSVQRARQQHPQVEQTPEQQKAGLKNEHLPVSPPLVQSEVAESKQTEPRKTLEVLKTFYTNNEAEHNISPHTELFQPATTNQSVQSLPFAPHDEQGQPGQTKINQRLSRAKQERKLYVLIKRKDEKTSKSEREGINKYFRLFIQPKHQVVPDTVATFDEYEMLSFVTPLFSEDFWFKHTPARKKNCLQSNKLSGKDFNEAENYVFDLVFQTADESDLVKMTPAEEFCTLALMVPNDKQFINFMCFLEKRVEYKQRVFDSMRDFTNNRDMDVMQRYYSKKKGMFYLYYALAQLYVEPASPHAEPSPRDNYIDRLFTDCERFENKDLSMELQAADNTFRHALLRIHYSNKTIGKQSELFNSLLNSYTQVNLPKLIGLLCIDNNREEKQRKFRKINLEKLLSAAKNYETSVLEHLYMMIVVLANIAVNTCTKMMDMFMGVLEKINTEVNSGTPYIREEMRQYEESLKKSIKRESDRIYNGKFYLTPPPDNDSFIGLLTMISTANPILVECLMNNKLEKVLKGHIFAALTFKNEATVIIIQKVFLPAKSKMVLKWVLFQQVLKQFFGKFSLNSNRLIKQHQANIGPVTLQEKTQTMFSAIILYPILLRKDTVIYRKMAIDSFVDNLIYSGRDFAAVTRIFSEPLEHPKHYDQIEDEWKKILEPSYSEIFRMLEEKTQTMNDIRIVESKEWLCILKLHEPLRGFLINRISHKMKLWRQSRNGKQNELPDRMVVDLIDYTNISDDERTEIMFILTDLNNPDSIMQDDIRKVLSEYPQRARYFTYGLLRGNMNVRRRIQGFATNIKIKISEEFKIKRSALIRTLSQKQCIKSLDELFSADQGAEPISKILGRLDEKCRLFMDDLKKISNLCQAFSNQVRIAWDVHLIAEDKFLEFSSGQISPIDFYMPPSLEAFRRLDPAIYSFYTSKLFSDSIKLRNDMSVAEFTTSLSQGLHSLSFTISQFLVKYRENILTMEDVFNLTRKLASVEDLRKLLQMPDKTGLGDPTPEQTASLAAIFIQNHEIRDFFCLSTSLKYLAERTNDAFEVDHTVFEKMRQSQFRSVQARDFLKSMQDLSALAHRYELRIEDSEDQVNKVMENTARATELSDIISSLKEGQIEELKDYLNEKEDEDNNLKSKNMNEFEHVYRYYLTVLNPATGIGDYLRRLHAFLSEESKNNDSESLATALEYCLQIQNELKNILLESRNREQSFKFKVEKLMDCSEIIIKQNEQTGDKDVLILYGQIEKIALRNLLYWRDKTLLLINAAKKNKEQVEEQILKKLNSFVKLYEALEDVLNSYGELGDMGYFAAFVNDSVTNEVKFKICRSSFDEFIGHNEVVRKECINWEREINNAYSMSFAFAHYQGRDLKRLATSIKEERYVPSLREVIPDLTDKRFREYMADPDVNTSFRRVGSPLDLLEFITKMFREFQKLDPLLNRVPMRQRRLHDNRIPITIIALVEERVYRGVLAPGIAALEYVNMPQILLCRDSTSIYDVKTFLMRAILDSSRPYFVIGTHYLNPRIQNSFCDTIERALQHETLKDNIRKINLYMIDNSLNERIYNYFANHKDKLFRVVRSEEISVEALSYFHKQAGPTKIVASSAAGIGKTFWIEQDIKRQGKQPYYFPVAGNLNLGRLSQRIRDLNLDDNSALLIQIHNIKDKKTLDEFLFQVVFFKCIKHDGFLYLPTRLPIYIELQNVLNQKHLEELQVLAILSRGEGIVKHLQRVQSTDIRIDPRNRKWMFVLKNLDLLHTKDIDKIELSFVQFCKKCDQNAPGMLLPQAKISELMEHYLFNPLRQVKNEPSFIQMVSFLSLSIPGPKSSIKQNIPRNPDKLQQQDEDTLFK